MANATSIAKSAIKKAGKGAKKAAVKTAKDVIKKKRKAIKAPKLYTETEKKYLHSLYNKRNRLKRKQLKLAAELSVAGSAVGPSLKDIREYISEDTARTLYYEGYFDEENYDRYQGRSFREWMIENGDGDALRSVMDEYATGIGRDVDELEEEFQEMTVNSDEYKKVSDELDLTNKELEHTEMRIEITRSKAKFRKDLAIAKNIGKKAYLKKDESLIDAIDKGHIDLSKLSNPEKAAVNNIKKQFAKAIIQSGVSDNLEDEAKQIASQAIYSGVMSNPMEGVRVAIRETVSAKVRMDYGNDAAKITSDLVDLATGKGSVKAVGLSMFEGVVNSAGIDETTLNERSRELIENNQSSIGAENFKKFGVKLLVDIAKDVIKSGGQIEAAIPMVIKSVLTEAVKAGASTARDIKREEKELDKRAKQIQKANKAKKKNVNVNEKDIMNKFFT